MILPFIILRRLDCILEPTKDQVLAEYKKLQYLKVDSGVVLKSTFKLPFYNTSRWTVASLVGDPVADNLIDYIERFSPWCPATGTGISAATAADPHAGQAPMVSGHRDRNQPGKAANYGPASMVSGHRDRSSGRTGRHHECSGVASMVSGHRDRNQTMPVGWPVPVPVTPQWCPATGTGIRSAYQVGATYERRPQWCPATGIGISGGFHAVRPRSFQPQWCPATGTGIR